MNNGQTKPGYNLQLGTQNQFILDFGLFQSPGDPFTMITFFNSLPNVTIDCRTRRLPIPAMARKRITDSWKRPALLLM